MNDSQDSEEPQDRSLGFDNANISVRGKWDNRYKSRGGMSFGATLDEEKSQAIGGGILTNERASEFYGQYQFVLPNLDPLSSFTLGEYVTREENFYTEGNRQVWGYTTYLNWFKRSDGRQSPSGDLPPGLRTGLQTLLNNVSALSGTAAYTHNPLVRQGTEGSPRTNALDLSLRAVTPSVFGEYLPVSVGAGVNTAHYHHVDNTTQNKIVGNGGLGIAFMGSDYFKNPIHWLVGAGGDGDTQGVVGGTAAAELGSLSFSVRHTSDQQTTVLAAWRMSDLWTDKEKQRASTLSVANGNAPLSFAASDRGAGMSEQFSRAENSLMRMGFLPPTGSETIRPADGQRTSASLQLSPASVAQQPLQVQQAIKRTQDLQRQVTAQKNSEVRNGSSKAVIVGLTLSASVGTKLANQLWATATSISNASASTFYAINTTWPDTRLTVSVTSNEIRVDLSQTCMGSIRVYQDNVSLGEVPTHLTMGLGCCFIAGTKVLMDDGSEKTIEEISVGEWLKGADGQINQVEVLHRPMLGSQHLYSINGSRHFVTGGHPFMTKEGWKAFDVGLAEQTNPGLVLGPLQVGDFIISDSGETRIETIQAQSASPETQLYNFAVSGNRTFFVREGGNAFLVHNK
ncbi:MAG: hypothetical protein HQL44_08765 [Alphaproteobacteria bacterium]|nr:hypothetical protein [Alphaproteobacteria bacterium]